MSTPDWPANPVDWPLLTGPVLKVGVLLAAVAALGLLIRRRRRWWLIAVPVCLTVVVVAVVLALLTIEVWWKPFPDKIPPEVTFWAAVAIGGVALAVARQFTRPRWYARIGYLGLAALVAVGGLLGINHYYGQFPDLRSTLGLPPPNSTDLTKVPPKTAPTLATEPGELGRKYVPPPNQPAKGEVVSVTIPGTVSHFQPNLPEWVYLPPAYLTTPRPVLPVLILLSGQPGSARDWLAGGQLAQRMDQYAAAHRGLAPVVIMPDYLGGPFKHPLCTDSPQGNVDTYLSVDVPAFVTRTFAVNPDHRYWAVGGFSAGGTCALQLGVKHPQEFPTFLSLSGSPEIWRNSEQYTVDHYFNGSVAAYRRANPVDVLKVRKYPHSVAAIFAATDDPNPGDQPRTVGLCKEAGMTVYSGIVPGTHSWTGWGGEATLIFPWLFQRWGLGSTGSG